MLEILPWTVRKAGSAAYLKVAESIVGAKLSGVRYFIPDGNSWPGDLRKDRDVHEVDHGVELRLSGRIFVRIRWEMRGPDYEGIGVKVDNERIAWESDSVKNVDVSYSSEWRTLIGRRIERIGIASHSPSGQHWSAPWSFRVDLSGDAAFAIALGEDCDGILEYMPDNIVVIFNERLGVSYRIADSLESAWGEALQS